MTVRPSPPTLRRSEAGGGVAFLSSLAAVAVGLGAARAATTSYVPVLLDDIAEQPGLIGVAMLSNALAGFLVPVAVGVWADRPRRLRRTLNPHHAL